MQYIRNGRVAVVISRKKINDNNINKKIKSMQARTGQKQKTGVTSSTHVRMHMQPMKMVSVQTKGRKEEYLRIDIQFQSLSTPEVLCLHDANASGQRGHVFHDGNH